MCRRRYNASSWWKDSGWSKSVNISVRAKASLRVDELNESKMRLKHIVAAESLEGTPEIADMSGLNKTSKGVSKRSCRMTEIETHQRVTLNGDPSGYVDRYQRVAGQNVRSSYQEKGEFISTLVSDTTGIHEAYVTRVGAGLDDWEMLPAGREKGIRRVRNAWK
ncbi:hypothetical protein BJ165DRAFT_1503770 [Panaeolus papilionaceus]|nr:hypothetical protein BJ165DRAFT_1503770 [Panaeolus papilionaceus]